MSEQWFPGCTAAKTGDMEPRSRERRRGYLICGAILVLAGAIWAAVVFSTGYGGLAAPGGTLLGVGAGLLIKWCVRPKKDWDLRDAPPSPKW